MCAHSHASASFAQVRAHLKEKILEQHSRSMKDCASSKQRNSVCVTSETLRVSHARSALRSSRHRAQLAAATITPIDTELDSCVVLDAPLPTSPSSHILTVGRVRAEIRRHATRRCCQVSAARGTRRCNGARQEPLASGQLRLRGRDRELESATRMVATLGMRASFDHSQTTVEIQRREVTHKT